MRIMRWVGALVTTTVLSAGLVAPTASAVGSFPMEPSPGRQCKTADKPKSRWTWKNTDKSWKLTHASRFENRSTSKVKKEVTVSHQTTVTAGVDFSTSVKVSAKKAIAELGVETGLTLRASGSRTATKGYKTSYTFKPGRTYVLYAGTRHAKGSFVHKTSGGCLHGAWTVKTSKGKARSFTTPTDGVLECGQKASGLAKHAKKHC